MPAFPTKEINITALAYRMIFGYLGYLEDFPHVDIAALTMLVTAYLDYTDARDVHSQARAAVKVAIEAKNTGLGKLKESMKNCLKKSEVDVAANPEKLTLIGWGPNALLRPPTRPASRLICAASLKDPEPSGSNGTGPHPLPEDRCEILSSNAGSNPPAAAVSAPGKSQVHPLTMKPF